jgi:beta-aspartyl-peptidase (threonine type)
MTTQTPNPTLIRFALHGGAGDLPASAGPQTEHRSVLTRIVQAATALLQDGGTALDAVTLAVVMMEECPLFNAGIGAVLNRNGLPELDAAIMDGRDRSTGAVAGISRVASPVRLARAVMEQSPHVLIAGGGAEALAAQLGLPMVDPQHFITVERVAQLAAARKTGAIILDHDDAFEPRAPDGAFGTVGAVARDAFGNLAAATSTGGLTNKLPGRVGDTALAGIGTFADDSSCAISCTGTGEAFIRAGFANDVHARIAYGGRTLDTACAESLDAVRIYGGRGGCIAIGRDGEVVTPFNSQCMYRAWVAGDGVVRVAIHPDEHDA